MKCGKCGGLVSVNEDGDNECFSCGKVFYSAAEVSSRLADFRADVAVEVTEVEARKNLHYILRNSLDLDALVARWLPEAGGSCGKVFRRGHITQGCSHCDLVLTRYDDVYHRRGCKNSIFLCEYCAVIEVLSVLYLSQCVGRWVLKQRTYEKVWRSEVKDCYPVLTR